MKHRKARKAKDIPTDTGQEKVPAHIQAVIASSGNEKMPPEEKRLLWRRIHKNLPEQPRSRVLFLKIAASVAFLLVAAAGWWFYDHINKTGDIVRQMELTAQQIQVEEEEETQLLVQDEASTHTDRPVYYTQVVPYGERFELTLPDSTRVWLNSGSKLVYPARFREKERQVYLEGEAYFRVQHDAAAPFYVQTKEVQVRVLGTEFNVSAYADDEKSKVTLVEGSVELTANKRAALRKMKKQLVPNEVAVYDPAQKELQIRSAGELDEYISWRNGCMSFNNTSLKEVLKKLERYYKVEILLNERVLGEETFSGSLDLQQDIEEIMDLIQATTSLSYQRAGERRIILGQ